MDPLEKKKILTKSFNQKLKQKESSNSEIIPFRDLNIKFNDETFDWHRNVNGGSKHD